MKGLWRRLHPRQETDIPVFLGLTTQNKAGEGTTHLTATMINCAPGGCCVVLTSPMLKGEHIFFKALNSDSICIHLLPQSTREAGAGILTRPVWMDSCVFREQQAFKIGLQFLEPQADLLFLWK